MSPLPAQPGHPQTPSPAARTDGSTLLLGRSAPESTTAWTPAGFTPATSTAQPAASRLGRFEVRQRLGGGSFGEVFRAYDPKLDREVALKIARSHALDDP